MRYKIKDGEIKMPTCSHCGTKCEYVGQIEEGIEVRAIARCPNKTRPEDGHGQSSIRITKGGVFR